MTRTLDRVVAKLLRSGRLMHGLCWLYRRGAGPLLGPRLLMVEHVGRTTGRPRYVCLEVVERPRPDTIVIVSGFGARAQWYRNLRATPRCHVSTGRLRRVAAEARFLSDAEASQTLERYRQAHPRAWRRLRGAIEHTIGRSVHGLPMVELTLAPAPGTPPIGR